MINDIGKQLDEYIRVLALEIRNSVCDPDDYPPMQAGNLSRIEKILTSHAMVMFSELTNFQKKTEIYYRPKKPLDNDKTI